MELGRRNWVTGMINKELRKIEKNKLRKGH